MTVRLLEYPCSPCTVVIQYSSTSHGSVFLSCCDVYVHLKMKTICFFSPHVELALEVSIILSGKIVSKNSRSSYCVGCLN